MFLIDGTLHWSASDLSTAAGCEYTVLRTLDYKLGLAERPDLADDVMLEHIAKLGYRHEERLLAEWQRTRGVTVLDHVDPPYTAATLGAARDATMAAFVRGDEVLHQAAFYDGEFFGYADFVENTDDGWLVADAKLARAAKPEALLQLGAYADQIQAMRLPLAPSVSLLLGNGKREDFRVADILPVFDERRARLRDLLRGHQGGGQPVAWGDERYVACGRCAECSAAIDASNDVVLVAGLRMEQRTKLRAAGISTVADLAEARVKPDGMTMATFEKLRAQAALQWKQMQGWTPVSHELTDSAADALRLLPAPSPGDLFFDFEGDPMHDEGDLGQIGLEYLWGVLDVHEHYTPIWAHDAAEERVAFVQFMQMVAERRVQHPDMHIYHYAPYEVTALKRLAMRYQTHEKELDDLLRSEVFVDLYSTVRGAIRVSQPSYSIKKLEPLYMGSQLRESDVEDGAQSIVAYQEFRALLATDPSAAEKEQKSLADYNEYDCLSTLRLRDWLLERAVDAGVRDQIVARAKVEETDDLSQADPLFLDLMERSGPDARSERTADQQAHAMLAAALDYHQREDKSFWWSHFDRLSHPIDDWGDPRDMFLIESAQVTDDWAHPGGRARNLRRTIRAVGDWTTGSVPSPSLFSTYAVPAPDRCTGPESGLYAAGRIQEVTADPADPRVWFVQEACPAADTYADLPVALTPAAPPRTANHQGAIRDIAAQAVSGGLASGAVADLLVQRPPRLRSAAGLPSSGDTIADVIAALISMDDSYLAVQGPPGTGKSYTASRVIKALVEKHHWRVGVVAQSHAVVETLFDGLVKAGLDPALVGKCKARAESPAWQKLSALPPYLDNHAETGCVVGGTAWDFCNAKAVDRRQLDLLVVEEAGQYSLADTMVASVSAQRLLLLGDPRQLPQVSQGAHPEPVDDSALGWLMGDAETLPSEFGYFLAESYRMHPDLCAKVSTLSYGDRLTSAAPAARRSLEGVDPGVEVVMLDHVGCHNQSPEEAAEVVRQVRAHLGLRWHDPDDQEAPRPLGVDDFRVVAPYNAQVICIREALDAAGLGGVRVGTVDKVQGQEAPIVIVSMTASSQGDAPRGMDFLLSRNRTNVAVSRAQWKAVLIRSAALTAFMPGSAAGVLELGAFIGLCGKPR